LGTNTNPVSQTVLRNTQAFFATFGDWVVKPNTLDEATIAANAFVGHNDVKKWTVLRTAACKSDDDHNVSFGWWDEEISIPTVSSMLQRLRHTTWPPGQRNAAKPAIVTRASTPSCARRNLKPGSTPHNQRMQTLTKTSPRTKNKTLAAWLAFLGGQLGLHRIYLYGFFDLLAWIHPIFAGLGWWGIERVRYYGLDDVLSWLLIPLLGFTLAATSLTAIYYGLMDTEKWNAKHNAASPETQAGNTNWLTIFAIVFALLFGAVALMSSIAFSFQRYFEHQVEEARKISQ
jgi:hypothetical protein